MDALTTLPRRGLPRASRVERVAALLSRAAAPPRPRHIILALLLAAPVPCTMALMSVLVVNYTHHDMFIPMDAAWRTLNGQWPHSDYYTPLGLFYVALHGAAARLWGLDGLVLVRANLLALPLVLVPGVLVGARRLGAFSTVLLTVLLSVLVTSPVFLDGPERLIAHLANYNRIGGGLCAVVALWALCPPRRPHPAADWIETVLIGAVFIVLLTLKLTFFALAAVSALAGCFTVRRFWRRAAAVAVLGLLGLAAIEVAHPGLMLAYAADVRRAGGANTVLFRGYYAPEAVLVNLLPFLLVLVLGVGAASLAPPQRRVAVLWQALGIFAVAAACVLVATQNFGAFSPPLAALLMLLAQRLADTEAAPESGVEGRGDGRAGAGPLAVLGLGAVLLVTTPFLFTQLAGTLYQVTLNRTRGSVPGNGRSPVLADVLWFPNPIERAFMPATFTLAEAAKWEAVPPPDVAASVLADGLDLLTREGLATRRIANLSFSNPFPAALRTPPPRGVALWWDEGRTFTTGRLTPDQALGDAEVVMVPKLWWHLSITAALLQVAESRLECCFTPHESTYWTAWARR